MRVFLTGGTGYVGSHVLKGLLAEGHAVTVMSRSAPEADLPEGAAAVKGDLADPESYREALKGHDAVVNCVGLIRNRRSKGQTFDRVVRRGTEALVRLAKLAQVKRFVQVSANGTKPEGTAYQETKWAAEQAVKGSGLPYVIFRPSIVFAPDDDFINQFRRLLRLGAVPYFGRGDYAFAPVHADDVAAAVAAALTTKEAVGKTFHVCGPERMSYREILRLVKQASGSRGLVVRMPKWMVRTAASLFGWMPFFPATNDMLTMLFEGNTCPESEWTEVLGVTPRPFAQTVRGYLGKGSA